MLQHRNVDQQLIPEILLALPAWTDRDSLEQITNQAVARLRRGRRNIANSLGWLQNAEVRLDDWIRTDVAEYLDDPGFPEKRRVGIVQSLHRFNRWVLAYQRFFNMLRPYLLRIEQQQGRAARILELASGSGEFSLALAKIAQHAGMSLSVTGSDYFVEHVNSCKNKALKQNLNVEFKQLNAFDLSGLPEHSYDLVFVAQSMHHFTPGQVAMMVHQSMRVAQTGFMGVDGQRSLSLFTIVPSAGVLMRSTDFIHDAWITLRKFYTESELAMIAQIAAPKAQVIARRSTLPGYSILTVMHPENNA
ncbi:MAG: class I SAM-dependent methyltransferase [Pseudomonadales bacterium]|nr:class I SAM-dependent methyltransferase [Pseudomonadales bacterium]